MKVLMTLMRLEIGGAETHVLELARALKQSGVDVTVASHGGVYVAELQKAGIPHVSLPLHTKRPLAVLYSYFGLRRLIRRERFDIVHAHARIPAFLCGHLQKHLHFRFVCSAHWVFDVNALWRSLAHWGDKTIAVSEDIKQYVIDNYGVSPDRISVTINGIDMEKFSPETDASEVARELSLPDDRRTIVYVSRLDTDRSAVARQLASLAPRLRARYPDLHLVIVGDGDDFAAVKALADRANTAAGTPYVHLTGARTDIGRLIALGDVFVGVSRAALEAMSAARPVVIAGNEGYIGPLSEDNLAVARATNFCCRGCPPSTEETLYQDLTALLDLSPDARKTLGLFGRSLIERDYSAARMARDCLAVYESLRPYAPARHSDVLISGYYGFGNMGDDSLLLSIVQNLHALAPDLSVTALTRRPAAMQRRYGVRCINRFHLLTVNREMRHARLLISGGGSLLQNNTSAKSLAYYIGIIRLARRHGLPVMVYANGIGPLYGEASRRRVKAVLRDVSYISLRDPASRDLLQEIGLIPAETAVPLIVSADPALSLAPATEARKRFLEARYGITPDTQACFAVSLREWQDLKTARGARSAEAFEAELVTALAALVTEQHLTPVFMPAQRSYDSAICRRVASRVQEATGHAVLLFEDGSADDIIALLQDMQFVIGMRLHMLIYASAAGIPAIGLSYDPKVSAFLSYAAQPAALDAGTVTTPELLRAVQTIRDDRDACCRAVTARCDVLKTYVREDAAAALALLARQS